MMMSQTWIKKILKVLAIVIAFVIGVMLLLIAVVGLFILIGYLESGGHPYHYETYSLEDYGNYQGSSNKFIGEYINRYFPEEIPDEYRDITFVYRNANSLDEYSFEAYLEFTFDSADAFNAHVLDATEGMLPGTFAFDEDYQEYVVYDSDDGFVYDHLMLENEYYENGEVSYSIGYAKIAKILVNVDEQRVIYVALALLDGGGTDTSFLRSYFERFDIDPKEYELYTESVGRVNVDGAS